MIPIDLQIFVFLVVSYFMWILFKIWRFISNVSWIPGPTPLFILGNYYDFSIPPPEEAFESLDKYHKKYGKIFKIWIGLTPVAYCQDRDTIQLIYKQEDKSSRPTLYRMVREFLGAGLLFGEADEKWRIHRKYLTESFHTNILEQNVVLTWKKINTLINLLENVNDKNKAIDLIEYTKPCFLDVSLGSIVGIESNSLEKPESCPYLEAVESMSDIVMGRVFNPIQKQDCMFSLKSLKKTEMEVKNTIKTFIKKIVQDRRQCQIEDSDKKRILADVMLTMEKRNEVFTLADVEDQVSNHIMASFDTLSTVTSFVIFLLANNLEIQEEVVKEINTVAPDILTEGTNLQELSNMKLLDRCFKETLRMYPAAPIIGRRLEQSFETKNGVLPAGLEVYTNLYSYHRDEEIFPNPDSFDPDRFLPENSRLRHPLSWMPFGTGSRSCIGQKAATVQSKVAVAMLLKKFQIKSYDSPDKLKLIANLVIKSKNGIRIYIQPRDQS